MRKSRMIPDAAEKHSTRAPFPDGAHDTPRSLTAEARFSDACAGKTQPRTCFRPSIYLPEKVRQLVFCAIRPCFAHCSEQGGNATAVWSVLPGELADMPFNASAGRGHTPPLSRSSATASPTDLPSDGSCRRFPVHTARGRSSAGAPSASDRQSVDPPRSCRATSRRTNRPV